MPLRLIRLLPLLLAAVLLIPGLLPGQNEPAAAAPAAPAAEAPAAATTTPAAATTTPAVEAVPPAEQRDGDPPVAGTTTEGRTTTPAARPSPTPRPGAGATVSAPAPQGFVMRAAADAIMLRMTPESLPDIQNVDVIEGAEFITDVVLVNPASRPIDRIRLVISYNSTFLNPVAVNDAAIASYLDDPPSIRVDRQRGVVIYEADLARPLSNLGEAMVFIRWQAVEPVYFVNVGFGRTREGDFTELWYRGSPVLGASYEEGDGTVSMNVSIIPSDPAEALVMREDPLLFLASDERVGGVTMRILPPERTPVVGETFHLDIVLDNTAYSKLDGVSMLIKFDPDILEIIDDDYDNWITHGHNISDGPFQSQFPWNFHLANLVYPVRGMIEYRMGTSMPDDFLGVNGTMARLVARAKAPTAGTAVHFVYTTRPGARTTSVTYLGQDVLGDTSIINDGAIGTFFAILPEPPDTARAPGN